MSNSDFEDDKEELAIDNTSLYSALSLEKGATSLDIKKAYRRLALRHHPDKSSSEESKGLFLQIQKAYAILSDAKKRKAYDDFGF